MRLRLEEQAATSLGFRRIMWFEELLSFIQWCCKELNKYFWGNFCEDLSLYNPVVLQRWPMVKG